MEKCIFYGTVLAALLFLLFLARKEPVFATKSISKWMVPFHRGGVYLFRRYRRMGSRRQGQMWTLGSSVTQDMRILDPSRDTRRHEMEYRIGKLSTLLLFVFIADVLAILTVYAANQNRIIGENGSIVRGRYGAQEQEVTARLKRGDQTQEDRSETYVFQVDARKYTEEEAEKLSNQFFTELPSLMRGENPDLQHVNQDLALLSRYEGYPFQVEWKSERYSLIGTEGAVHVEDFTEGTTQDVTLTAVARYEGSQFEECFGVTLIPIHYEEEEAFRIDVMQALETENVESGTKDVFRLPKELDGVALSWMEEIQDDSLLLFCLIVAAGLVNYWMSDRELHREIERRQREMAIDYPQILSKIVLFLGAGMSVRNIFQKLGADYHMAKEKGGRTQYVYEEILLVCHELDSGVSEYDAYMHFGMRCRMRQYIKLCSLLTQNLRKGNAALLSVLQEEADLAFVERKNIARQMGEEAGTKLLLPMMMLLAVTLVIIIIPAYYSFSV